MKRHQTTLLLSETELNQLYIYCCWAVENGVYYGVKAAFISRHGHICQEIEKALASIEAKR